MLVPKSNPSNPLSKNSKEVRFGNNIDPSTLAHASNQQFKFLKMIIAILVDYRKKKEKTNMFDFLEQKIKSVKSTRDYMAEQSNGNMLNINDYLSDGDIDGDSDREGVKSKSLMEIT